MLYSLQIRAARAALKITITQLAELTGLSYRTIQVLESGDIAIEKANFKTLKNIKRTYEEKGIKFLYPKEEGSMEGVGIRYYPIEE